MYELQQLGLESLLCLKSIKNYNTCVALSSPIFASALGFPAPLPPLAVHCCQ